MLNFTIMSELPLKEMDGALLSMTLLETLSNRGVETDKVQQAIALASYLHRDDVRGARARLPKDSYITHPLRVALRIVRSYHAETFAGEDIVDVVIAAILHDTVEDHYEDILTLTFGKEVPEVSPVESMSDALTIIGGYFGENVAKSVAAVSNPPHMPGEKSLTKAEKRKNYQENIQSKIQSSDKAVFAIKFSDFFDNAGSLHHNMSGGALQHLVLKYRPIVSILRARLEQDVAQSPDMNFSDFDKLIIGRQLDKVEARLKAVEIEIEDSEQ